MKEKRAKIGVQRHIRIADSEIIEQIERITKLPGYESANKVINEALFYGMPILCEKLLGGTVTEKEKETLITPRNSGSTDEEFYAVATRLLKETVLNVAINKSILSSIFNFICDKYSDERNVTKEFSTGLLADTPEYLGSFEAEGIKKLRR